MNKEQQDKINVGVICPYCLSETYLTYGKYGNMLKCDPCKAWVSTTTVNGSTGRGRLADYELRQLRQKFEYKKRHVLNNSWFKKKEFQSLCYWRGGKLTDNIYLLEASGIRNILQPLEQFIFMKTNEPYKNNSHIKALFKIQHYDKGE